MEQIDAALAAPHWPLSLGRKAFVPGLPVRVVLPGGQPALFDEPLVEALATFADHSRSGAPEPSDTWRVVLDADAVTDAIAPVTRRMQPDLPLSFSPRRFTPREVVVGTLQPVPSHVPQ